MWYIIAGCFLISACSGESLYVADNARVKRQDQQHQPQPAQAEPQFHYRPYNEAPESIKHLLQAQQAREPLVHIPVHSESQLKPRPAHKQVQLGQAPALRNYKGNHQVQLSPQAGLGPASSRAYTPSYKQSYSPQSGPNAVYPDAAQGPAPAQYQSQPQAALRQYPKNLPPHIMKIIEQQRAFQG